MAPGSFLKRQKRDQDVVDDPKIPFDGMKRYDSFFSDKPNFELFKRHESNLFETHSEQMNQRLLQNDVLENQDEPHIAP